MNTPDTEWEKEFNKMRKGTGQFIVPTNAVKQFIETLLSSRDTYWKEREKEVIKSIIRVAKNSAEVDRIASQRLRELTNEDNLK